MTLTTLMLAASIIFAWAIWSIFSPHVNDGIVGKIIYSFVALAAFAIITSRNPSGDGCRFASEALDWGFAMLAVRQVSCRYVWPLIRRHVSPCDICPQRRAGDL